MFNKLRYNNWSKVSSRKKIVKNIILLIIVIVCLIKLGDI